MTTREMDVWRIAAAGGEPERITRHETWVVSPVALDNRTLLYSSLAEDGSGPWLYGIDVDRRLPHRIGLGVEQYRSVSGTADGRRLLASVANPSGHLWRLPILDRVTADTDASQVTLANVRAVSPSVGPDYLLYLSSRGGGDGIWKSENGTAFELWEAREGGIVSSPAVTRDGRQIAFTARRQARGQLYVMNSDGTAVRTVGERLSVSGVPSWSPDAQWLAVIADSENGPRLFKVPVDGGTPVLLVDEFASSPAWSPDGRMIAYSGPNISLQNPLKAVTPEGRAVQFPAIWVRNGGQRYRFMPDSKALVFMRGDWKSQDFYLLDLATGQERRLSHFEPEYTMRSFDVSSDGKEIVFNRVNDNSDIVLIDLRAR